MVGEAPRSQKIKQGVEGGFLYVYVEICRLVVTLPHLEVEILEDCTLYFYLARYCCEQYHPAYVLGRVTYRDSTCTCHSLLNIQSCPRDGWGRIHPHISVDACMRV